MADKPEGSRKTEKLKGYGGDVFATMVATMRICSVLWATAMAKKQRSRGQTADVREGGWRRAVRRGPSEMPPHLYIHSNLSPYNAQWEHPQRALDAPVHTRRRNKTSTSEQLLESINAFHHTR